MEQYLKQVIEDAKRKNEYFTRDWGKYPIPKLPRETQLKQQSTAYAAALAMSTSQLKPFTMPVAPTTVQQIQDKLMQSKFGQPPTTTTNIVQPNNINSNPTFKNLMTLYDVLKEKQVQSINANAIIKKPPVSYNMDFMLLQANKEKSQEIIVTTQQIKAQQQLIRKNEEEEEANTDHKIIGACQDLEKDYYRLTGLPDPITIRPEEILKKSLDFILLKWKNGEAEYDYIVGQFRSIRQDLTVQHIQNSFAVRVYEENARIALECGDFPRYDTCWSVLCDLYEIVGHAENKKLSEVGNHIEFDSYRIVYLTMLGKQDQLVKILNQQDKVDDEQFKFALELNIIKYQIILSVYKSGNWVKLFQLYKDCSETMESLINQFLLRIRVRALKQFMKSYVGTIEIEYLSEVLAFQDRDHFRQFLGFFELCKLDKKEEFIIIKDSINAFDAVNFDKIND